MSALVALTREPSASLADCELSHIDRRPIDISVARRQHAAYREALREAGAGVVVLPALDTLPDAAFVGDAAVVLDEIAVLGALGVGSRGAETEAIVSEVEQHRPVRRLTLPRATLEGGDVLRIGRTPYVGRSARTDDAGIESLRALAEPLGYLVRAVPVAGCLHLKTACTRAGDGMVLRAGLQPAEVAIGEFQKAEAGLSCLSLLVPPV